MYLKSLELQGFKSFVEKTVLTFDRGMSAVVGPNGSGKSNVSDAIRWVLGEQSTKTLRSNRMEDVIFKGTAERGPVGYAEVSLILDNSDGVLPIETTEVMVTRRYFRSGDSEYYINKTPSRLRDVHELFMDTGLGRDGYSIIGQGRIDEILSVKSGDRREIFEEAAGISKYRYRKEEAERKLSGTEQNLVRITDKIAELEISVEPLREQAEKAKKFLILRDELRVLEVSLWTAGLERLKVSSAKVRADFETVSTQLEHEMAALSDLYAKSEHHAAAMREKDVEMETRRAALSEIDAQMHAAGGEAEVADNRIANIKENISRLESESAEQSGRERSLGDQIAEREQRVAEAQKLLVEVDAQIVELESEITRLLDASGELEAHEDALNAKLTGLESRASGCRVERSSIDASAAELDARQSRVTAELELKRTEEQQIGSEFGKKTAEALEAREQSESLKNVISGYEIRLEKRRVKLDAANDKLTKLRLEKSVADSRHNLLRDMEREYEGFSRAVKMVMQEHESGGLQGIHGPLSKLIKTTDEHSVAVEIAMGGALQNIVVDTEEVAKSAIEYLKRRDGGRATFLPLSALRSRTLEDDPAAENGFIAWAPELVETEEKYREIIENLLGKTVVVDSMDNAIAIARKYEHRFRIVTTEGQIINAGGAITGGSMNRGTGILSRANELAKLSKSIAKLDEEIKAWERDQRELQREVTAAGYEVEVARTELKAAGDRALKCEGEASTAGAKLENAMAVIASLEQETADIAVRLKSGAARAAAVDADLAELEKQSSSLRAELEKVRAGRGEMSGKRGSLSDRMSELRERRSATNAEIIGILDGIAELKRMGEQFGTDRERRAALMETYAAEIESLTQSAESARGRAASISSECDQIRAAIAAISAVRMADEAARTAADKGAQEKNQAIVNLERERGRLEQKKGEAEMEERQLIDRLWESYELTPLTAITVAVPVENLQNAQRDVSQKRRQISSLGEVNVGAVEEFARINERYTYLSEQAADVQKSKRELETIIAEITDKMRDIFSVEFHRINESFQITFAELFGGGKASLRLEDEEDILNCGISIDVRLPGKAMMAISALSGGERAFVAIALYFAILKVRPTPFCVLDEVDTALDDMNVVRFAQYMKSLCGQTQFVSVTHKRGTMEECDVLYGVTMQNAGVSKILALNIGDVEKSLGMKLK